MYKRGLWKRMSFVLDGPLDKLLHFLSGQRAGWIFQAATLIPPGINRWDKEAGGAQELRPALHFVDARTALFFGRHFRSQIGARQLRSSGGSPKAPGPECSGHLSEADRNPWGSSGRFASAGWSSLEWIGQRKPIFLGYCIVVFPKRE